MTESENMDQFMTRVMGIMNQIILIGEAITDQRIVEKVLRSLPKKFEMVVTAVITPGSYLGLQAKYAW
jgi:hypothetical protein